MPDLEQLTANSKVSPGWILLGHADDQSAALGCDGWSAPAWTATVGCPFPTHQCTVPAENRLWPDKQSRPSRPREPGAQSRHDHSILGAQRTRWICRSLLALGVGAPAPPPGAWLDRRDWWQTHRATSESANRSLKPPRRRESLTPRGHRVLQPSAT